MECPTCNGSGELLECKRCGNSLQTRHADHEYFIYYSSLTKPPREIQHFCPSCERDFFTQMFYLHNKGKGKKKRE